MMWEYPSNVNVNVIDQVKEGRVDLNLSETLLTSIPKEIFSFSHLIKLVLDSNEIHQIPNELCENLINLQILSLAHNAIREVTPKISNLKNLEVLDLSYNEITEIQPEISTLDFKLRVLNFNCNMISQIPESISRLSNLQALELYGNDVEQIPNLSRMSSLSRLNLAANPIVFISAENLPKNLKHLTSSLPQQIISNLYIGDYTTAAQHKTLKYYGVTHVVSCLADEQPLFPEMFKYHMVNLNDDEKEDLLSTIPNAQQFIEEAIQNGGTVFVHCAAGVSRSASICIAFVMRAMKLRYEEAFKVVHKARPIIQPNSGFVTQLFKYETQLFG